MADSQDVSAKLQKEIVFEPALQQIGTTDCPICKTRVAVFLAKTNRPFINCSFCSARIFYNGQESIRLLKKRMKPVNDSDGSPLLLT
ncbi:MAG: hypothetical protein ACRD28_05620 [Acidobacteriaceae bacterium]